MTASKAKALANPSTYKGNIMSIVVGTGETSHPSFNRCRLEILAPRSIFIFENRFIGNKGESLYSIAKKYDVNKSTVSTYYNAYIELRETDTLTQEQVSYYLEINDLLYPLYDIEPLQQQNNKLSINELQCKILEEIESQKLFIQSQSTIIENLTSTNNTLQEQNTELRHQLMKLQTSEEQRSEVSKDILSKLATQTMDNAKSSRETQRVVQALLEQKQCSQVDNNLIELHKLRELVALHLTTYNKLMTLLNPVRDELSPILQKADDDLTIYTKLCNEQHIAARLLRFVFNQGESIHRYFDSLDYDYTVLYRNIGLEEDVNDNNI